MSGSDSRHQKNLRQLEEIRRAEELAKLVGSRFIRLLQIIPAEAKGQFRVYFSDGLQVVRCVTVPISVLERPARLKERIGKEWGFFARHYTEYLPKASVTAHWRSEVDGALWEGERFLAGYDPSRPNEGIEV